MKISLYTILIFFTAISINAQIRNKKIIISENLELIRVTENVLIHVSYNELAQYGRFPSNGMIYTDGQKAFLFDTPMKESLTRELVYYLMDTMKIQITAFIPNHWHNDCIGGLEFLNSLNIASYANDKTVDIINFKNLASIKNGFADSLILRMGNKNVVCKYLGGGHTVDNIIVWLPYEKILFGGCMIKEVNSKSLGNIADADLDQWPVTIRKVMAEYLDVEYVIPGHGQIGGIELLFHTLGLLMNKN